MCASTHVHYPCTIDADTLGLAHVAAVNTVPTLFVTVLCSDGEQLELSRIPHSHPLDLDFDAINARL